MMSDKLGWLMSVVETSRSDLKTLRKYKCNSSQRLVDGAYFVEPYQVAEAFTRHFQSVYTNTPSEIPVNFSWASSSGTRWFKYDRDDLCVNKSQFVPVIFEPPCNSLLCFVTLSDLRKAVNLSESVRLHGVSGFVKDWLCWYVSMFSALACPGPVFILLEAICCHAYFFKKGSSAHLFNHRALCAFQ
jgi:hypothetical protein